MRRIVLTGSHARLRARRWDVVVVGSALPGLVAAVRLAMDRLRVLLVEEATTARLPAALREPFFVPATPSAGILDACLRALALPLIDRRRLTPDPISFQVVLPEARVSVGAPALTGEELVAWGLAKPEQARELVRAIAEAAAAERLALLAAPLVHSGGSLRSRARGMGLGRTPRHERGLPSVVAQPTPALAPFFAAQVRALAHVACAPVAPEARARLLGAPLEGGVALNPRDGALRTLLQRRFASLHGETRTLGGRFELVSVDDGAGLAPCDSGDVWLGRALILNAPRGPLAQQLRDAGSEPPAFLEPAGAGSRRLSILLRARPEVVPEGMARRVIVVRDAVRPRQELDIVTLALFPMGERETQLVASTLQPEEPGDLREKERLLEATVRSLMPFAEGRLQRVESPPRPRWDDEAALEDPTPGGGWPGESELRVSARPRIYRLPREDFGAVGLEGDCLLGWRAGDAIAAELG